MLRLGSFLLVLWAITAQAQTLIPLGGSGGGGAPSTIPAGTPVTGCGTPNGVFYNSSNTFACASGFTTSGTEAAIASGTQTTNLPILALSQTWNNGATAFTGMFIDIADTASAVGTSLILARTASTPRFTVDKSGAVLVVGNLAAFNTSGNLVLGSARQIGFASAGSVAVSSAPDTILSRKAAANWQVGAADAAAPIAQILSTQSVVAGTTNTAGVNTTVIASRSTGSGISGDYIIQTGGTGAAATVQNSAVTALTIKGASQAVRAATTIGTGGYTVSTLPAAAVIGDRAYVTDQLTACVATGAPLVSGGAIVCPAFYNGSAWVGG